jgi:tetratricopeptide (TPR) repeat protein
MTSRATVDDYLRRSDHLIDKDDWATQAELMQEATTSFPEETEFWVRRALALVDSDSAAAARFAGHAAELADSDPGVLMRCASLLFDLQRFEDSARYVKIVSRIAPDDFPLIPDVLHLAGRLAARKGLSETAATYLSKAFEIDPGGLGHARVWAEYLVDQGKFDEALDVIAVGMEHDPHDYSALVALRDRVRLGG